MLFELLAKTVTAELAEFAWLVGFADAPMSTTQYLLLTRGVEDDEQDACLGMDTYHVEINDQVRSCYGGISTLALEPGELTITFSPKGSKDLGCDQARIKFELAPHELSSLKSVLCSVLAGSDVRATGLV